MSERVSSELAQTIADGDGFAIPSRFGNEDIERILARDLLDCRKELVTIYDLATRLTAEVTIEWTGMAQSLCDAINASAARAAEEEKGR